jgi:hypothetical protein
MRFSTEVLVDMMVNMVTPSNVGCGGCGLSIIYGGDGANAVLTMGGMGCDGLSSGYCRLR